MRLRTGDTSSGDVLLDDGAIESLVTLEGNKELAAAAAADSIAAVFARKVDKAVGKLRISLTQASEHYFSLAERLRSEASMRNVSAYAGGISRSDRDSELADTDRSGPQFSVGQFDNPGIASSSGI